MKFRAWDSKYNKYFKPTYEAYNGKIEELLMSQSGQLLLRTFNDTIHESMFPNRFKVERFSGLKDISDRGIYEGDIVKCEFWNGEAIIDPVSLGFVDCETFSEGYVIGVVRFMPSTGFVLTRAKVVDEYNETIKKVSHSWIVRSKSKVIGNIHENKNLLEVALC